jgi:hypothetical protein
MAFTRVLAASLVAASLVAAAPLGRATAQRTVVLALRFSPGERIVEHGDSVDRIQWLLPPEKLEGFRRAGFVIDEELRRSFVAHGRVLSVENGVALIRGDVRFDLHDVPRSRFSTRQVSADERITQRNTEAGASSQPYDVTDAPMLDLPAHPLALGESWTTVQHVLSTLGSGDMTFVHTVAESSGGLVRVDVTGEGRITGAEYKQPRLLPGSMRLSGSAWFDTRLGLITQESYQVDSLLAMAAGTSRIGFSEVLYSDSDLHKEPADAGANH